MLDIARPALERYAAAHRMDLHTPDIPDRFPRPASWFKVQLVDQLLWDGYETVVWVDADTLFVRFDRSIVDLSPRGHSLWMVKHRIEGRDYLLPNCGVLVAHRDPRLTAFLAEVWRQEQWVTHPWWEQAAILSLLGWNVEQPGGLASPGLSTDWSDLVGFLGVEWNSMRYDPHPDPVVKHYTGMGWAERVRMMREGAR